ncbi:MAG: hypothetical protein HY908_25690 [Myxococcales bacterium]|nr:hypothetical protein [Myxococcales bacterium]
MATPRRDPDQNEPRSPPVRAPSAACALALAALAGCAAAPPPEARAKVDPVFDVPREYRILSTLPCAEGAGLVYLVSHAGELYSFAPSSLEMRLIGALDCPAPRGVGPNSMAVDRSGTAWLSYNDGGLYRASTRDAHCTATGFVPGQHGFGRFGMAFASSGPDLGDETLYVWGGWGSEYAARGGRRRSDTRRDPWGMGEPGDDDGWQGLPDERDGDPFERDERDERERRGPRARREVRDGLGLARVDRRALRLSPIGDDGGRLSAEWADLTGTGDGRVFGFFATYPATLAELDPATGAVLARRRLQSVVTGQGWAFSFWGGDFWFYWAPEGTTSNVSRLSADGTLREVLHDVGFVIVGAGVSTCAPTGPS